MTLKLALLALALLIGWLLFFRPRQPRRKAPPAARPAAPRVALEACPRCGVYRLPAGDCGCDRPQAAG